MVEPLVCFQIPLTGIEIAGHEKGKHPAHAPRTPTKGQTMPLLENMQKETVSRLALREPVTTTADESIESAIRKMRDRGLWCAIVIDDDRRPLGMFTEAMLTQLLSQDQLAIDEPVGDHLSSQWPWVKLTDPIADVLAALELKNVRFLCVVDEDGRLVGLTGQKGLMEYVAEHFPEVTAQRIGGSPFPHHREGA